MRKSKFEHILNRTTSTIDQSKSHKLSRKLSKRLMALSTAAAVTSLFAQSRAHATTTYYWDSNGAATTAAAATGTWGSSAFWSTDSTGASTTANTTITSADDVVFSAASNTTGGTVTVSTTKVASSITFDDNAAITISGGTSITIGGTGTGNGVFATSAVGLASTISTSIILNSANSAFNFSNAGTGLLTIGAVTGSAAGTQTVTIGSTNSGGITLNGIIGNGGGGGTVALVVSNSGAGVTTFSGANTYTGGLSIKQGTVSAITSASALGGTGTGSVTLGDSAIGLGATLKIDGRTFANPITLASGATGALVLANTATAAVYSGNITGSNGFTVNNIGAAASTLTISGNLSNTGLITSNGTSTAATTLSGNISSANTVGITVNSSGSLILLGANNSYSGTTTLTAGTLQGNVTTNTSLAPVSPFGTSSLALNGGTLQLRALGTQNTTAETIVFGNNVTIGGGTTIDVARSAATSTNKNIQLGTLSLGAFTLNVTTANTYALIFGNTTLTGAATINTVAANVTFGDMDNNGVAANTLSTTGAGLVTLAGSGNNTQFIGTLGAGTLQLNKTAGKNAFAGDLSFSTGTVKYLASDQIANTSNITMTGGTLALNGFSDTIANLSITGGTVTGTGNLTVNNASFNGASFTNTGAGLVLNGNVSFSGAATTLNGPLTIAATSVWSNTSGNTVIVASSTGGSPTYTYNAQLVLNGGTFQFGTGLGAAGVAIPGSGSGGVKITNNSIVIDGDTQSTVFGTGTLELNSGTLINQASTARVIAAPMSITGDFGFDSGGTAGITFSGGGSTTGDRTLTVTTVTTTFDTLALTLGGNLTTTGNGGLALNGGLNLGNADRVFTSGATLGTTIAGPIDASSSGLKLVLSGAGITVGTVTAGATNPVNLYVDSSSNAVTFNGTGNFTGGVTLQSGKININQSGNATTGPLGNGGTLTINGGTVDNTSGAARVVVNVNPIVIGGSFAFGTSAGTILNGLTLPGAVSLAADQTITLNGNTAFALSGVLTNTGDSVRTLTVNKGAGNGPNTALTLGGYTLTSNATSTAARTDVIAGNASVKITGTISDGTGGTNAGSGLTYNGSAALTLSGNNTFTGPLSLSSGTLFLNSSLAIANASAISIADGTTIDNNSGGTIALLGSVSTITGTATAGNSTVVVSSTSGLAVGQLVSGTGIAANTGFYITAIDTGNSTITLNTGTGVTAGSSLLSFGAKETANWNGNFTYGGTNSLLFSASGISLGASTVKVTDAGAGGMTVFGGSVTGTADLILQANSTGGIRFNTLMNNAGAISTTGAGTGAFTLAGGIGSNVTGVTHSSAGAFTISGVGASFSGNLTLSGTGSAAVTLSGPINNSGYIINNGTTTGGTTITGLIGSNVLGVIQNSTTSTLSLNTVTQTFNAPVTVLAGTLQVNGNAGTTIPSGLGTFYLGDTASNSANVTLRVDQVSGFSNPVVVQSGTTGKIRILGVNTSGGFSFTGGITLNNDLWFEAQNGVGQTQTYNGNITGTGNLTFNSLSGSGGAQTVGGTINITGNITNIGAGTGVSTIPTLTSTVGVVSQNSATSVLILNGNSTTFSSGVQINAGTLRLSSVNGLGIGTTTLGAAGSGNATLQISSGGNTAGVNGTTNIVLNSANTGTLTFTGFNIVHSGYEGNISLNGHDLFLGATSTTGSTDFTMRGAVTGTGNVSLFSTVNANLFVAGLLNNSGYILDNTATSSALTISGSIGANVVGVIHNNSAVQLSLTGNNSFFTGTVDVQQGTLSVGGGVSTVALSSANTVNIAAGATLDVFPTSGGNLTIGGLTGSGTAALHTGSSRTLILAGNGTYVFSGNISNSANTFSVIKSGVGTQSLNGESTYNGATTISGGKLLVNNTTGSATGTGNVTVAANATLGGNGSISGKVTTADNTAVISAGNSPGNLTIGSLDASAGARIKTEIGSTDAPGDTDHLVITGQITGSTAAGGLVMDLVSWGFDPAGPKTGVTYTLVTFGSVQAGTLQDTDFTALLTSGLVLDTTFGATDTLGTNGNSNFRLTTSSVEIRFSSVPEPTSLSLLGLGTGGLLARRRRKRSTRAGL